MTSPRVSSPEASKVPEAASSTRPLAASVVVPSRAGRGRLPVLLEALAHQTRQDFEVLVAVDGDVDGTAAFLEEHRASTPYLLRAVVLSENRGRSAALNAGIAAARARILIRLDDDMEPAPDTVDRHIRAHGEQELSAVAGLTQDVLPDSAYARAYGRPQVRRFAQQALATTPQRQWRYWAGNCSATRAAHALVGGYDEDYRRYGWEDVDFGYRLHAAGVPLRLDGGFDVAHHAAAGSVLARAQRALHSGASRDVFVSKHGPGPLGEVHRPSGPWGLAVRAVAAVLTEPVLRWVAGGADRALPHLPVPVAGKLAALCVEAAGRSGALHPARARKTF